MKQVILFIGCLAGSAMLTAQPANRLPRGVQDALRDQQDWQRKQLPVNSALYKVQYGSGRYYDDVRYSFGPKGNRTTFQAPEFPVAPPSRPLRVLGMPAENGPVPQSAHSPYKPMIPAGHALLMKRDFLPPKGYK
ncbi:MAG TPA: hypothetical protein VK907_07260 [Phnomibacter sp.]|nr:hypothetical protein [Phnomibacter sp.]